VIIHERLAMKLKKIVIVLKMLSLLSGITNIEKFL
jgi:hypothetical protein